MDLGWRGSSLAMPDCLLPQRVQDEYYPPILPEVS